MASRATLIRKPSVMVPHRVAPAPRPERKIIPVPRTPRAAAGEKKQAPDYTPMSIGGVTRVFQEVKHDAMRLSNPARQLLITLNTKSAEALEHTGTSDKSPEIFVRMVEEKARPEVTDAWNRWTDAKRATEKDLEKARQAARLAVLRNSFRLGLIAAQDNAINRGARTIMEMDVQSSAQEVFADFKIDARFVGEMDVKKIPLPMTGAERKQALEAKYHIINVAPVQGSREEKKAARSPAPRVRSPMSQLSQADKEAYEKELKALNEDINTNGGLIAITRMNKMIKIGTTRFAKGTRDYIFAQLAKYILESKQNPQTIATTVERKAREQKIVVARDAELPYWEQVQSMVIQAVLDKIATAIETGRIKTSTVTMTAVAEAWEEASKLLP